MKTHLKTNAEAPRSQSSIAVDDFIYALRNRIERCFNRLKNAKRLATRYDKTARKLHRLHSHRLAALSGEKLCQ